MWHHPCSHMTEYWAAHLPGLTRSTPLFLDPTSQQSTFHRTAENNCISTQCKEMTEKSTSYLKGFIEKFYKVKLIDKQWTKREIIKNLLSASFNFVFPRRGRFAATIRQHRQTDRHVREPLQIYNFPSPLGQTHCAYLKAWVAADAVIRYLDGSKNISALCRWALCDSDDDILLELLPRDD